jgi:hypothetical protein
MSYALPNRRFYPLGSAADVLSCKGPKGKAGRLIEIHVAATTTFTAGSILVGTAADTDAYASFSFGALADTDSASTLDGVTDTDAIIQPLIPADTQVELTYANGGAGAGPAFVVIDWDD